METMTRLLMTEKWELTSVVRGELAGAQAEKARLVGVLKAGLFSAELLLGIYLPGVSAQVPSDKV